MLPHNSPSISPESLPNILCRFAECKSDCHASPGDVVAGVSEEIEDDLLKAYDVPEEVLEIEEVVATIEPRFWTAPEPGIVYGVELFDPRLRGRLRIRLRLCVWPMISVFRSTCAGAIGNAV